MSCEKPSDHKHHTHVNAEKVSPSLLRGQTQRKTTLEPAASRSLQRDQGLMLHMVQKHGGSPDRGTSHPRRCDMLEPPYTGLVSVRILARADCMQDEHSMKFSMLCSPASSEENMPSAVSEGIPSMPPKAMAKEAKLLASPFSRCRLYTLA